MRQRFLKDCQAGDILEDVYVITNKQLAAGSNGKQYIKGFLGDRTCQVTARMWNATRDMFAAMPDNGFVRVRARVENYQNNLQLIIENFWDADPEQFDVGDLIPHTKKDIGQMFARLTAILGTIRNKHLAAIVGAFTKDERLMVCFRKSPAAQTFHHAYLGGLLEHTLNAVEVADAVCKFYPTLNRDLVIAGIFLHDIAKTWELTYETSFGYSDGGILVGHIVKAAMWVERKRQAAEHALGEPVPQALVDVLQHIILSHHGELADGFGSAKSPATPEAFAVHMIENMDAKLTMALAVTRGDALPGAEGNWTEYQKAFSGKLYRPDVAPPDVAGDQNEEPPAEPEVLTKELAPVQAAKADAVPVAAPEPAAKIEITNPLFGSFQPKRK